ncbi:MAG: iron-containing redox enzyme family protein [Clostridium sp.]
MYDKNEFKIKLRKTLEDNLTLSHPLFNIIMDEENPNLEILKFTTLQGYQLTKNFLTYIEHLFFYCPLPKHKMHLLHNMYEEQTGFLSKTKNHVKLMEDFIVAIGISNGERDQATPLKNTQELIDYRMDACTNIEKYHIGAAAVMVASEGQNLEKMGEEARHNILGKTYDLSDESLYFFSVHQKEDVGHVKQGISLLADYCTTTDMQEEALFCIDHTCKLFYNMYQGIYEYYELDIQEKTLVE